MAAYTLHVDARATPGDPAALERAVVVRDGFSWGALVFGPLWYLWHRAWLATLAYVVAIVALVLLCRAVGAVDGAYAWALFFLALFFAHEANAIRSRTLERRGLPAVDVVVTDDRDGAEARLFARFVERRGTGGRGAGVASPLRPPAMPVLGLFPEPESRR